MEEKQNGNKEPGRKRGWPSLIPALWSIEAIVIAGGLIIGALTGMLLAKPAFNADLKGQGVAYAATAVVSALIPIIGVIHIHGFPRVNGAPWERNRKA